jgi:hypothetical protein
MGSLIENMQSVLEPFARKCYVMLPFTSMHNEVERGGKYAYVYQGGASIL